MSFISLLSKTNSGVGLVSVLKRTMDFIPAIFMLTRGATIKPKLWPFQLFTYNLCSNIIAYIFFNISFMPSKLHYNTGFSQAHM